MEVRREKGGLEEGRGGENWLVRGRGRGATLRSGTGGLQAEEPPPRLYSAAQSPQGVLEKS